MDTRIVLELLDDHGNNPHDCSVRVSQLTALLEIIISILMLTKCKMVDDYAYGCDFGEL